jgi:protein SCO1/2
MAVAIFLAACSGRKAAIRLPYYNTADFTPLLLDGSQEADRQVTHTIGNFSCTDQHGHPVTDRSVYGKIHVANFFFTGCGSICPVIMKHLKILQQAFGQNNNVVMLSYSVAPWVDTVGRLRKYAANMHITSPNWHLLTGTRNGIYTLARHDYFAEEDLGFSKDSADFLHTEHILLVDRKLRLRGIYNGTLQLEVEQLQKDIDQLLQEDD